MINVAELDERIDRCLAILADNPHSQVFAALAEAYRRRGEFGRAFSVCKSGLKHHPDYGPAHVVLAKLYLYQHMFGDALDALRRAVELDGQTRATDLLEAEIQLAIGDSVAAQTVIDRLKIADPGNPGLAGFVEQLKQLRAPKSSHGDEVSTVATAHGEFLSVPEMRVPPESIEWDAWTKTIGGMRGVETAFVYDRIDQIVAVHPQSGEAKVHADSVLSLAHVLDDLLLRDAWGPLRELSIETDRQEIWTRKNGDLAFGLIGLRAMSFGATRQRGIELAGRVQSPPSFDAVTPPPPMGASHNDLPLGA